MKERPILFSAPMVRAILEGRKTQTRRVVKPQPTESFATDYNDDGSIKERRSYGWSWKKGTMWPHVDIFPGGESLFRQFCPYGAVGDRLWVRETWRPFYTDGAIYLADAGTHRLNASSEAEAKRMWPGWKPSIHMPRKHSRITLDITGVRVERLQDISEADATAEGARRIDWEYTSGEQPDNNRDAFQCLWESINGAESWAANPWVWAIEFKRVTP